MSKITYLSRSFANFLSPKICPYCSGSKNKIVDRKFIFTTLNQCEDCNLMFRHPIDTVKFNNKYYQNEYIQCDGITTDLPDEAKLKIMMDNNFRDSGKDYSEKINIIQALKPGPRRIVDYGANWGYTSFQLMKAGFEVQAYEISKTRAQYGSKLGLEISTELGQLTGGVDVFFNSHVIEHLPEIKKMFLVAKELLNTEGLFVAYCPNGSDAFKRQNKERFHKFWGEVHPNYIDDKFLKQVFKDVPYIIGSNRSDIKEIKAWDMGSQTILDLTGDEIFVIAKIKHQEF